MTRGNLWLCVYPAVAWANKCCHSSPYPTPWAIFVALVVAVLISSCTWAVQTPGKPTSPCQCTRAPKFPSLEGGGTWPKSCAKLCVQHRLCGRPGLGVSSNSCLADTLGFLSCPLSPCAQHSQAKSRQETHQSLKNSLMLFAFRQMKNKAHFCCSFEGKKCVFQVAAYDSNFKWKLFLLWKKGVFCSKGW